MKKLIPFAILAITLASCGVKNYIGCHAYSNNEIIIKPTGDNEGRQYYSVYMPDGTIHEYMYAEEIARGLTENNWTADEDLILAYANQE
jgi:hypothetical protein